MWCWCVQSAWLQSKEERLYGGCRLLHKQVHCHNRLVREREKRLVAVVVRQATLQGLHLIISHMHATCMPRAAAAANWLTCTCAAGSDMHVCPFTQVQKLHDLYIAEVEKLKKVKDTELREHKD